MKKWIIMISAYETIETSTIHVKKFSQVNNLYAISCTGDFGLSLYLYSDKNTISNMLMKKGFSQLLKGCLLQLHVPEWWISVLLLLQVWRSPTNHLTLHSTRYSVQNFDLPWNQWPPRYPVITLCNFFYLSESLE